jgi:hypothetical protein
MKEASMPRNPNQLRLTPREDAETDRMMKLIRPQIKQQVHEALSPLEEKIQAVIRKLAGTPVEELPL